MNKGILQKSDGKKKNQMTNALLKGPSTTQSKHSLQFLFLK